MHHNHSIIRCASGLLVFGAAAAVLSAQYSVTSLGFGVYTQDFNTLATSGDANPWIDNITLPGWYAAGFPGGDYSALSATDIRTPRDLYSFGTGTDRALGSVNTPGGAPIYYGVKLLNATGTAITSFTLSVDAEKYEASGGNDSTRAAFGFGLTGIDSATGWLTAPSLDVNNQVIGTTLTFTPAEPLYWAPGDTLWLRWAEIDSSGQDRSFAIDNLSLSIVPEPSFYGLLLGIGTLCLSILHRRRALRLAGRFA